MKLIRAGIVGSLFAAAPFGALAVSPLVTDDADTVEQGKLQLGTGAEYFQDATARRWSWLVNPVVGFHERGELGVSFGYAWQQRRDAAGGPSTDGVLDTTLAAKWKWFDQAHHGFSFSTRLDLKIPTAAEAKGLGTGKTDVGGVLIATRTIGHTSLDFNLGYTFFDPADGGMTDDELFIGQTVRHTLSERWAIVGEVFVRVPVGGDRDTTLNFNGGVQCFLRPNLVLEASALTATGRNSADLAAYLGLTWVF